MASRESSGKDLGQTDNEPLPVAAGHAARGGTPICAEHSEDGRPRTILKVLDEVEAKVYSLLQEERFRTDPIQEFIPDFYGEVSDTDPEGNVTRFIRISNLLQEFRQPKVMDVKLGIRTFLESECTNTKLRPDLFTRMAELYPWEVTPEERSAKAITKHRWMTVRDNNSTIGPLGHRIDGVAGYGVAQSKDSAKELAAIRSVEDTRAAFKAFADVAAGEEYDVIGARAADIAEGLRSRLNKMRKAMGESAFVAGHEFIGSSVLLIADSRGRTGVYWIDFAKTHPAPHGQLTHRTPWKVGNHEDGIIVGMERLAKSWEEVARSLRSNGIIAEDGTTPQASVSGGSTSSSTLGFSWALKRSSKLPATHISHVSLASHIDGMPATLPEEPGYAALKASKLARQRSTESVMRARRCCFGCLGKKPLDPAPEEVDEVVSSVFVEHDEEGSQMAHRRSVGRIPTNLLVFSDASVLSSLPSLSGIVTETNHRGLIWSAAERVRQDAEVARQRSAAAVNAAAEVGGMVGGAVAGAVVEGAATVRGAGRRSTRGLQEVLHRVAATATGASYASSLSATTGSAESLGDAAQDGQASRSMSSEPGQQDLQKGDASCEVQPPRIVTDLSVEILKEDSAKIDVLKPPTHGADTVEIPTTSRMVRIRSNSTSKLVIISL